MTRSFTTIRDQVLAGMGELAGQSPEVMRAFGGLHRAALAPGALSTQVKELIALGIAIAVRCEGCIACHVKDALDAGATAAEIAETIDVAILMGGGPSVVYGVEAHEALAEHLRVPASA